MTTNWKRTETANGAGAHALSVFARVCAAPGRRHAVLKHYIDNGKKVLSR